MPNLPHFKYIEKDSLVLFDKVIGQTPFQCVQILRNLKPEFEKIKVGYAGRLDPMASGLLVLLLGVANKGKADFEMLEKEYELEVLFGISTDSLDRLGVIQGFSDKQVSFHNDFLSEFIGVNEMTYPVFSAKRVQGKPLFYYAHNHLLPEIVVPKRKVEIHYLENLGLAEIEGKVVIAEFLNILTNISGDFRQGEIEESWRRNGSRLKAHKFQLLKIKVTCGSGTFMRWLAQEVASKLGTIGIAYNIRRTRVGKYSLGDLL